MSFLRNESDVDPQILDFLRGGHSMYGAPFDFEKSRLLAWYANDEVWTDWYDAEFVGIFQMMEEYWYLDAWHDTTGWGCQDGWDIQGPFADMNDLIVNAMSNLDRERILEFHNVFFA